MEAGELIPLPSHGDPHDLDTYNDRFADAEVEQQDATLYGDPETNAQVRGAFHAQEPGHTDDVLEVVYEAEAWWVQDTAREELWEAHADGETWRFVLVN